VPLGGRARTVLQPLSGDRGFGESAQLPIGHVDLALDVRGVKGRDMERVVADRDVDERVAREAGQRGVQRLVDVDVGCAESDPARVDAVGEQVQPRIDAVAGGELLESKPVSGRCDDGVERALAGSREVEVAGCSRPRASVHGPSPP
jgi:hypothetical protein